MRLGLQVSNFTYPNGQSQLGDTFAQIARRAERAGFSSLWAMDHFFQIGGIGPAEHEMLEGWSALAFAAGQTNHIQLGTLVTGVTYRYPGLLVKTATTLDVLIHKLDVLRGHCRRLGRPYEEIEKTSLSTLNLTAHGSNGTTTPQEAVNFFAHLAGLGIDHGIIGLPNVTELEVFDVLAAEVIPQVEKITPAGR